MLNGGYGETVTCPVCERRIYRANDSEVMKVARGSRQAKVNKRWAASKNLVHPEPEYEYVTARSWYRCEAKAPAGYYVEKGSEEKGIVSPEYYGYGYYRYRLVQLEYGLPAYITDVIVSACLSDIRDCANKELISK